MARTNQGGRDMRKTYVTLVSMLLVSLTTTAWADPDKDESGHGRYDRHDA